jgi:uncharacterized protein
MALFLLTSAPGETSRVLGIFMATDALAILGVGVAAVSGKTLLAILLAISAVRFLLLACVQSGASQTINLASGTLGLLLGVFALYGGLALLLEDVRQRTVLPLLRYGVAQQSLETGLADQIDRPQREAGVRQQL